ncbi:hypothetical protein [Mesorhizobium retamae]|uniref:Uncharacterized protein n=1 Tax=Mesorhizobium retamae TaxID=2912854 RepID=A0ABS9QJP1_9HYPH|nr:hypothetical protein [Mesorhizobium sp. IRAMC:0171]MCG7507631.1 hypothetical protein [Mesorhizobium sp. IRAMC:0171]
MNSTYHCAAGSTTFRLGRHCTPALFEIAQLSSIDDIRAHVANEAASDFLAHQHRERTAIRLIAFCQEKPVNELFSCYRSSLRKEAGDMDKTAKTNSMFMTGQGSIISFWMSLHWER